LSIVSQKAVLINNANNVPDDYLLPREQCIDTKKIEDALAAGKEIPGVSLGSKLIIRTKLPEIIV
jgi:hypothetical protein